MARVGGSWAINSGGRDAWKSVEGEVGGHPNNIGLAHACCATGARTRVPWPTYDPFISAITVRAS